MITGIDINQRIEVTLDSDKTEPKTVFVVRPLSGMDRIVIGTDESDVPVAVKILSRSIVEIKNNNDIPVNEFLYMLSIDDLNGLLGKVNELNEITDEEVKN